MEVDQVARERIATACERRSLQLVVTLEELDGRAMVQPRTEPGDRVAAAIPVAERIQLIRDGLINYSRSSSRGSWGSLSSRRCLTGSESSRTACGSAFSPSVAVVRGEVDFGLNTIVTRGCGCLTVGARGNGSAPGDRGSGLFHSGRGRRRARGLVRSCVRHAFVRRAAGVGAVRLRHGRPTVLCRPSKAFCIALFYGLRRFAAANAMIASVAALAGSGTIAILLGGGGLNAVAAWQAGTAMIVAAAGRSPCETRGQPLRVRASIVGHASPPCSSESQARSLRSASTFSGSLPIVIGPILGSRPIASYDVGPKFSLSRRLAGAHPKLSSRRRAWKAERAAFNGDGASWTRSPAGTCSSSALLGGARGPQRPASSPLGSTHRHNLRRRSSNSSPWPCSSTRSVSAPCTSSGRRDGRACYSPSSAQRRSGDWD